MKAFSLLVALAFGSLGLTELVRNPGIHELVARQRGGGGGGGGGWGGEGGGEEEEPEPEPTPARGTGRGGGGGGSSGTCEWSGHCAGATCDTENDCDGQLGCVNGKCATVGGAPATTARPPVRTTARTTLRTTARPTPTPVACEWTGHCAGATCKTENDCDGQLGCVSGKCASVGANPPVVSTPRPPTSTRPGVITVTVTRSGTPIPTRPGGGGNSPQPCGDSPLACIGASCKTDADCGFTLIICDNGVCGL